MPRAYSTALQALQNRDYLLSLRIEHQTWTEMFTYSIHHSLTFFYTPRYLCILVDGPNPEKNFRAHSEFLEGCLDKLCNVETTSHFALNAQSYNLNCTVNRTGIK